VLFQDERLRATSAGSLSPATAGAIATGAGVSVSCSEAVRMGLAGSDWEKKKKKRLTAGRAWRLD